MASKAAAGKGKAAVESHGNGNGDDGVAIADIKSKVMRTRLAELGPEIRTLTEEITEREESKKDMLTEVREIMDALGIRKAIGDGFNIIKASGGSTKISDRKLLELGVPLTTIDAATEHKTWEYVQVVKPK